MEKIYTLQDIIDDAIVEYNDRRKDYPKDDRDDVIHEIADSSVPIYYSELLTLASGDNSLALDVPELGPAFDGKPTPVNIIAANVYEAITNALYEID